MEAVSTYTAKVIEVLEASAERGEVLRIGIFKQHKEVEEQIGEYTRNFPKLLHTFYPFRKHHKDYALYSPDYTATRIMELPSCRDLGGENPDPSGFCPVEFYIPSYVTQSETVTFEESQTSIEVSRDSIVLNPTPENMKTATSTERWPDIQTGVLSDVTITVSPTSPRLYCAFGFVAGFIWGDPQIRLQYLDLTDVENGILHRDARFGVVNLSHEIPLSQAVRFCGPLDDTHPETVQILTQQMYDCRTGKTISEELEPELAEHFFRKENPLSTEHHNIHSKE